MLFRGRRGGGGTGGATGLSAYDVWLANGNVGTEADFLASLVGPQGPEGPAGADGAAGTGTGGAVDLSAYPTMEDLSQVVADASTVNVSGYIAPLAIVPYTGRASWGSVMWPGTRPTGQTAADHWFAELGKYPWDDQAAALGAFVPIVSKTTYDNLPDGESPVNYQAWTFDSAVWDDVAAELRYRDTLVVRWTKVGAPASFSRAVYGFRVEPAPVAP